MITLEQAIEIAKNCDCYPVCKAYDLDIEWLVSYDSGNPPIPGVRSTLVNKETGKTRSFFPPDYEGIEPSEENLVWSV